MSDPGDPEVLLERFAPGGEGAGGWVGGGRVALLAGGEPHIFLPTEVEAIRAQLELRDRTLVSVLAYSGPRPEEVVCRLAWSDIGEHAIRYVDTKRHRARHTPLLKP